LATDIGREISLAHKRGHDYGRATVSAQDAPEPTEDNAALAEAACVALGLPFGFTTPDMIRKAVESVRDMADQSGHRRGYAMGREHGKREEQREQRRARYVLGGLTPEQHDAAREQHTGEPPRAVEALSERVDAALVDIRERL